MTWSVGFRFFVVGMLALFMFIPLFFVGSIIDSRVSYLRDAVFEVSNEWGGPQTINGPRLIIPVEGPVTRNEARQVVDPRTGKVEVETFEVTEIQHKAPLYIYPSSFDVSLDTASEERRRGIFRVPVYSTEMDITFDFDVPEQGAETGDDEALLWEEAYLELLVSSNRALRGASELTLDGRALALEPLAASQPGKGGFTADIGDPRGGPRFRLKLGLTGAQELFVSPVGRSSQIRMTSDWPHPSFTGAFLPDTSEVTEMGFSAEWTIPHLARPWPQISRYDYSDDARSAALGVRFFQPNDFYQKAYRAARYGILFIALTFLTVLLIENTTRRPIHPVQYILIGLAQSIFVLLMVAYAEQIGFGPAYLLSSTATVMLLVMFGFLGLKFGRGSLVLGAMLVVLYAVLYLILRSTDFALLAGATLSFMALAGTMYATRNAEWYRPAQPGEKRGWFGQRIEAAASASAPESGASPSPGSG